MGKVLTESSRVTCGHSPGSVAVTGNGKLTVSGRPVLLAEGIQGKGVSGCSTAQSDKTKPCSSVASVSGAASKLKVGGRGVMLEDTIGGSTDGNPTGSVGATANQGKLKAR